MLTFHCAGCGGLLTGFKGSLGSIRTCGNPKCRPSYSNTVSEQMKEKQVQRFGRLVQSFGDFGELRRQHKKPHKEVFYIPVKKTVNTAIGIFTLTKAEGGEVLRSVNNCSNEQITDFIQTVGKNLEAGNLSQDKGETVLNYLYQEIERRVSRETPKSA